MRTFSVAIVAIALGLLGYLAWFELNDPGRGVITDKHYTRAWCTTGKTITCYPECYEIDYTDGKHDGDACVTPLEYDRYRIGGNYPEGAQ